MYTLNMETKNHELLGYLNQESLEIKPLSYSFDTKEHACKTLSRYMFYFLREQMIQQLIQTKQLDETKKEDFVLYISSDHILDILRCISKKVSHYLEEQSTFYFEGFIPFRLKEEKEKMKSLLKNALNDYHEFDDSKTDLSSLEEILHAQIPSEEELFIIMEPNNRIVLRNKKKVYLVEQGKNEDAVLSHLIILAPKTVKVFETCGKLTRETVIILRHLFKDKVAFTREKFYANQYSKE